MKKKRRKDENENVLQFGLQFCYRLIENKIPCDDSSNYMLEVDGQKTKKYNGVLIINDARSPYNGLSMRYEIN
jgi:hypothetical protein